MSANDLSLRNAVNDLYCDHHGWLKGWLRKRLGNAFDAADLAQDTFVRVIKARNALEIREPRPYLSMIAKGLLIDLFRRRSLEQSYLEALAAMPEWQQPSLEEQAILLQALMEIDRLLQGLGTKVKQAFILSQFDGLTYPQIAERLNISTRTVNNYMAKAMEHCCLMQIRLQLAVLVLVSAGSLGGLGWHSETSRKLFADFRTAVGERREFRLADGSALLLNTDTSVNIRFDGRHRVLDLLRGEIRVTTAVDPLQRPFKVLTRHAEVLALGTRFIVRCDEQGAGVAVIEKAVEVRSAGAGSTVRVEAGQSLDFDGRSLGVIRRNDASVGAWQQGSIIAINRPLAELLDDLSRYRPGVLRCDPRIAQLKVSGAFPIDDTDLALAALESGFALQVTRYSRYWVDVSSPATTLS
eukprot:gene11059-biopygen9641